MSKNLMKWSNTSHHCKHYKRTLLSNYYISKIDRCACNYAFSFSECHKFISPKKKKRRRIKLESTEILKSTLFFLISSDSCHKKDVVRTSEYSFKITFDLGWHWNDLRWPWFMSPKSFLIWPQNDIWPRVTLTPTPDSSHSKCNRSVILQVYFRKVQVSVALS